MFEVEHTALVYTLAPGHYKQNQPSNRLNHTKVTKQAVHFLSKGPLFSEARNARGYHE